MKSRKIIFKSAFVIGVGLFVFLIIKVGPMNILENISKLTWKSLGILFVLRLIYWVIRTYIWRRVCQCYGDSYSFSNFFAARMAGHAVSYLTPATYIGGAAFRTMSVSSLNKTKVLASVIVEKTVEIITALLLTVIGVLMAVFRISIPEGFKYISIIGILFAVLLILFVFLKQRKGLITWFVQSLQRVRIDLIYNTGRGIMDIRNMADSILNDLEGANKYLPSIFGVNIINDNILLWSSERNEDMKFKIDIYDMNFNFIKSVYHYNFLPLNLVKTRNNRLYIPNMALNKNEFEKLPGRLSMFNVPYKIFVYKLE